MFSRTFIKLNQNNFLLAFVNKSKESSEAVHTLKGKMAAVTYKMMAGDKKKNMWLNVSFFFLTALLTITHVTYSKLNSQKEMKYMCKVI